MSTLYLHIPFCKSRCAYCDFFSTVPPHSAVKEAYVQALCREMEVRKDEAEGALQSIYFGGGTPSQLSVSQLATLMQHIRRYFALQADAEITLEANPDDVSTAGWAESVRALGFNRMSLGVQSFHDEVLHTISRRHTALQARRAVALLRDAGFQNISIDLIFGLPGQDLTAWQEDLQEAFALPVQHLSAYALQVEEGTPLARRIQCGEFAAPSDELSRTMYEMLCQYAKDAGYEHYEISNFCRPGFPSRHNSAYWNGTPYIGLGPGAHSYDGKTTRRANTPDLSLYLRALSAAAPRDFYDLEPLSEQERLNERVFTALRTRYGISVHALREEFSDAYVKQILASARRSLEAGNLLLTPDGVLRLAPHALFISDEIISDLMQI